MGVYAEYLDSLKGFRAISDERKTQLRRISDLRGGRDVLVIASNIEARASTAIAYSDLLPIRDQLDNLKGHELDVILETPGGSAEITEDIVHLLRKRYDVLAFIVPGVAKSAGTIMVMAGDEILMDAASSLGPIDAQVTYQGKVFSADAFLEGLDKIKKEVEDSGSLNKAYIPILQGISPGEIQRCENAQNFSRKLVSSWLERYKFRHWINHRRSGEEVTDKERKEIALKIARKLCQHSHWLTHGRSVKIDDLDEMGLRTTNYAEIPELSDAIKRYHTLLRITFDTTSIYKIFETPDSQIYRYVTPSAPQKKSSENDGRAVAMVEFSCPKCNNIFELQANLGQHQPLKKGAVLFPENDIVICPNCGTESNIREIRNQIEAQTKQRIVK